MGLVCVPWVWSIPLALMTAELSSAMPENGVASCGWISLRVVLVVPERVLVFVFFHLRGLYLYCSWTIRELQRHQDGDVPVSPWVRCSSSPRASSTSTASRWSPRRVSTHVRVLAPFLAIIVVGAPNINFASPPIPPNPWLACICHHLVVVTAGIRPDRSVCRGVNPARTLIFSMMYAMTASLAIDFVPSRLGSASSPIRTSGRMVCSWGSGDTGRADAAGMFSWVLRSAPWDYYARC